MVLEPYYSGNYHLIYLFLDEPIFYNLSYNVLVWPSKTSQVFWPCDMPVPIPVVHNLMNVLYNMNILVNVLRLGLMNTPMHTRTPGYTQKHLEARAKLVPLGRMGESEEAARWVCHLLGPDSDFMTGQIISLSGGD